MSRFTEITSRKGTRSVKWDYAAELYQSDDVLPMWVADMDFQVPEPVIEALEERVKHGIFGYTMPDDQVKETITSWLYKRHDWEMEKDWITYSPGVIPSLHMIIQSLTQPSDSVIIQTPVYPPFYSVIKQHDRKLVTNPLIYQNEEYSIDFSDFENKIVEHDVKIFILCNPHNPIGRVWKRDELIKLSEICLRHEVTIVSDEIHADLVFKPNTHIPIASLSEEVNQSAITCLSPTKTFNLAGLQASYLVTADEEKRKQIKAQFDKQGMFMLNTLGLTAMEAAYRDGEEWLEELLKTLEKNRDYVTERIHNEIDEIRVIHAEGTYLIWLDFRKLNLSHKELKSFMQKKAKIGLNDGESFGEEGQGFMRINVAAPPKIVQDGVDRIIQAVKNHRQ
ncbi:MalY/PatB family protein [Halobacillus sp. Marseille-Q1614]|uniref:MalY/PatB family protein n=1 Tax=Halobacillus sp. Marseille-Q1614 TaxID=2709134 RepID=UPI001570B4F6|nr:MalY/PatB family protein [Halobacillus sp. Marseille-Q1614]